MAPLEVTGKGSRVFRSTFLPSDGTVDHVSRKSGGIQDGIPNSQMNEPKRRPHRTTNAEGKNTYMSWTNKPLDYFCPGAGY